jgi:hypothetical protein
MAAKRGYEWGIAETTGPSSLKVWKKFAPFEEKKQIPYNSFMFKGV